MKKRRNLLILCLSLLLFVVSTFYFFLGIHMQEYSKLPDIGEVFKKNNDLRRKINGTLAWVDIEHSSKLFPGDKVFTGAQSLAQLNLLDLAKVGMNSSTLLRVDPKTLNELSLQAGLGFFTTSLSGNLNKAAVQFKNAAFELNGKGTEVAVNGLEEKTMITALAGGVSYRAPGSVGMSRLAPNQLLGMNRAGASRVVDLPAKLISPTSGEELVISPKVPVNFKWKILITGVPLVLELSKSPGFETIFVRKEINGEEDNIAIDGSQEGVLYWRIVQPGNDEYYYAQQFEYQPLRAPLIYDPVDRQNYPVIAPTGPEFTWEKRFDFSYEGEIQQLDGGVGGAQKFKGLYPSYLAKNLTKGHYQLKVRGTKNGKFTEWTEWRPFSIGDMKMEPLDLVSPVDMATAHFVMPEKVVVFEWAGGMGQAQIQIASDEDFKSIVFEGTTDKNTFRWRPKNEGKVFWRVRAASNVSTQARALLVVEPKIELLEPRDKASYEYTTAGTLPMKFSWGDMSLDDQYVLEFANTPDFKKSVQQFSVSKPTFDWTFPMQSETIYWRVKTARQTTPVRMFTIYPKPVIAAPVIENLVRLKIQSDLTVMAGKNRDRRAPTQYGPDYVEIFFPQIENASAYHLEVYRDAYGKNLVLRTSVKYPVFKWEHPPVGEFYWNLAFTDKRRTKSPPSPFSRLIIMPKDKQPEYEPVVAPSKKYINTAPY